MSQCIRERHTERYSLRSFLDGFNSDDQAMWSFTITAKSSGKIVEQEVLVQKHEAQWEEMQERQDALEDPSQEEKHKPEYLTAIECAHHMMEETDYVIPQTAEEMTSLLEATAIFARATQEKK